MKYLVIVAMPDGSVQQLEFVTKEPIHDDLDRSSFVRFSLTDGTIALLSLNRIIQITEIEG